MATRKAPTNTGPIELVKIARESIVIPIVGLTPYIPHKWTPKAVEAMLAKHTAKDGAFKATREPKNPEQDAYDSTYWIVDGEVPGVPAGAFALAMKEAIRSFANLEIVSGKTHYWVKGEAPKNLVRLLDCEWEMHEDTPRNSNGNPDLRHRNYVWPWRAELEVNFKSSLISITSIVALVEEAGSMGVGDWRPCAPKKPGIYGQWEIDQSRSVRML